MQIRPQLKAHRLRGSMSLPVPEDMRHLVNYDERIIWVLHGSEYVVVSDQRIIIRKSGGLGLRKSFVDYPYSNMVNIRLDRGVMKSSVEILMRSGVQNIKIGNLTKADAFQLHRVLRENIVKGSSASSAQPLPVIIQSGNPSDRKPENGEEGCRCEKCGHKISSDFTLCPFCRDRLKIECPECAKTVDSKFKLCPYCGEDLSYIDKDDLEL